MSFQNESAKQESSPIATVSQFNPSSDVKFQKPKINKSGGKNVGILNNKTKSPLQLSTPLILTWGAQENDFDGNGKKTYDMALQFPSEEYETPKLKEFLDKMKEFETHVKAACMENSKEWMNKTKLSQDVTDALWSPMLKYPKDKESGEPDYSRAPTLRIKIPYWDGKFDTEIYDVNQNCLFPNDNGVMPVALIAKATQVAVVMQCGGVWFANGKFGVTWRLFQAVVKPKASLRGRCHVQLDSNEVERIKIQHVEDDDVAAEDSDNAEVEDSDQEDEDEVAEMEVKTPEPEPTPEPEKPKKKKKVVRKKKAES
jgi:hypothetical protein